MTEITRRALAAAPLALAAGHALRRAEAAAAAAARASPWPDATETAARIRSAARSPPLEAVETAIRRAEALQGTLNFIVNSDFDRALDKAKAGTPAGPFGGVPFLVKDLVDYRGLPTRAGLAVRRAAPPATQPGAQLRRLRPGGPGGARQVGDAGVRLPADHRADGHRPDPQSLGPDAAPRAARRAARRWPWPPASCRPPTPPTAAARSASRPPTAASSA